MCNVVIKDVHTKSRVFIIRIFKFKTFPMAVKPNMKTVTSLIKITLSIIYTYKLDGIGI